MKFNLEIDCTPEEARTFLGLPDLRPLHESVVARLEQSMTEAADRFSPEGVLRTWLTLASPGAAQNAAEFFRAFSQQFFKPPAPPGGTDKG